MTFMPKIYNSWKSLQLKKYKEIVKHIPKGQILDIGIGSGFLQNILERNWIGIDISLDMLKQIKKPIPVTLGSGEALPFKPVFDAIVCIDTIHLIDTQDFIRVLKPNAVIIASLPFNKTNLKEKRKLLQNKLSQFTIQQEVIIDGKESEIVFIGTYNE